MHGEAENRRALYRIDYIEYWKTELTAGRQVLEEV